MPERYLAEARLRSTQRCLPLMLLPTWRPRVTDLGRDNSLVRRSCKGALPDVAEVRVSNK
jgi:hypothetical protein